MKDSIVLAQDLPKTKPETKACVQVTDFGNQSQKTVLKDRTS